ncbi:MAG: Holliday junction resolvase RuvX [Candidatus Omnitrophica bacterium]|nr:Holliday junction resolvase RuvX [Candidatus Omnitrophota bacterium]
MKRVLGLDIGSKRIGVAVSDPLGITAQSLAVIKAESDQEIVEKLKPIINDQKVDEIVLGLPLNMNGTEGPQAKRVIEFCDFLKGEINIPVKLWDERMTTAQVERIMIEADVTRKKRKEKIDKLAAQVILQSYLDSIK